MVSPIPNEEPTLAPRTPPTSGYSEPPFGPRPLSVGQAGARQVGEYELLEEVARGGMGVVYKARHIKLGRIVALKMILAGQLADESAVLRFQQEARAAAALDHPGLVPIFDIGEHKGQQYFTMPFIEGRSLAEVVTAGPMPPRESAELMSQVAEAVNYAAPAWHRASRPEAGQHSHRSEPAAARHRFRSRQAGRTRQRI
ncbi:MAG: serine/threonine-protein kinase [Planctomycetaceae bacterium]